MSTDPATVLIEFPERRLEADEEDKDLSTGSGTDSLSSSEAGSNDGDDDSEEEDSSDEDSCYSDSSSDHSLGSIIERMGGVSFGGPPQVNLDRSMPNLMQLETEPDQSNMKAEHRRSLSNFMTRMNNCSTATYFQEAKAGRPTPTTKTPQRARSTGALDDINKSTKSTDKQSPANYFKDMILKGIVREEDATFSEGFWDCYFLPVSPERIKGYTNETVAAIRAMDIDALRKMVLEHGDSVMDSCSRQGESLLHVACRRGNEDVVRFMVQEAHAAVKVRDDWNKTAFHDLAWNHKAGNQAQFQSVELLLEQAPELLFSKDKRGFTALQYVPKDSWVEWCRYLEQEKDIIQSKIKAMNFD